MPAAAITELMDIYIFIGYRHMRAAKHPGHHQHRAEKAQ